MLVAWPLPEGPRAALPEGYGLENWGATCAVKKHDTCFESYNNHGITLSAAHGELW